MFTPNFSSVNDNSTFVKWPPLRKKVTVTHDDGIGKFNSKIANIAACFLV